MKGNAPPHRPAAASRRQIADLTQAYCRSIDRADETALKSVFHDDSMVVSGVFSGNGQQFASEICRIVRAVFDQTFHSITDQHIEVNGDTAIGETYVVAISTISDCEGKSEMLSGGRYIDRFERRAGVWKFAEHSIVSDWSRIVRTTSPCPHGLNASLIAPQAQDPGIITPIVWH